VLGYAAVLTARNRRGIGVRFVRSMLAGRLCKLRVNGVDLR